MQCRINRSLILLTGLIACVSARADFNEATKAYLLGDFENARYEALIAATDGMPEAQMLLGQLYFNGEGVEKDIKIAMYWYEKAASQNFADAQFRLGTLYYDGKHGIEKNYNQAYLWLNKALENGNKKAQPILEGLYKLDDGNVVNLEESLDKLQEIANKGNKQARYLYSQRLLKGTGFPQDKVKAVKILTEDSQQGFVKAQKRLGELYFYGDGVVQDYYEAYAWSMAYAGTRELGGLAREGKQTARSALRKLDDEKHHDAYVKSKDYFEKYVLPFHPNAREVGPEKYRIVVRSRKAQLAQSQMQKQAQAKKPARTASQQTLTASKTSDVSICEKIEKDKTNPQRTKQDVAPVFEHHQNDIYALYNIELRKSPNLQGKLVYELEINSAGKVTRIDKRAESTIKAAMFEASLVKRIKQINFCRKGTAPFVVAYPIEFIPTAGALPEQTDPALERTKAAVARSQGSAKKSGSAGVEGTGKGAIGASLQQTSANSQGKTNDKLELSTSSPVSAANNPSTAAVTVGASTASAATLLTESSAQAQGKSQVGSSQLESPIEGSQSGEVKPESKPLATASETQAEQESSLKASESIDGVTKGKTDVKMNNTGTPTESEKTKVAGLAQEKRSYREIHNVFIRHRTRLNSIYQRAYSQDNGLRGRMVFNLTINPDGKVVQTEVSSSDLDSPALEQELIDYIKNIDFTRKNTDPFEVSYPLDFLP